jgi:hypothetical protein
MLSFHRSCLLILALLALAFTGCGKATGDVTGIVKFKGQPLNGGSVIFADSSGTLVQTQIGTDGKFTAQGVSVGNNKIAVYYVDNRINEYAQEIASRGKGGLQPMASMPKLDTSEMLTLPAQYSTPDKSGLSFDVKSGQNNYDIDIPGT